MTAGVANMDSLRLLVMQVARSFYEHKFVIVMDLLARNQVLKDDDLAGRMGLQSKELNKLTAILLQDKLIKVYRRNELKEGATRAVGRGYYYIDYKHFCDVVKWRVAEMRRLIDKDLRNELDTKGYICPQCETSYTPLDVDRLIDFSTGAFLCEVCRTELIDNENAESVRGSQDRMQRFNRQMTCIREGLRKSEEMVLPAFDVEAWVRANTVDTEKEDESDGLKIAGGRHGVNEGLGVVMSVGIDEATRRAEKEREAEEKRQQNQMPLWHLQSTISGDLTALGIQAAAREAELNRTSSHILESLTAKPVEGLPSLDEAKPFTNGAISGLPMDVKPVINQQADYYDRYYARLEAGPERSKSEASWDGSDDDKEDVKPSAQQLEISLARSRKRTRSPPEITEEDRGAKYLRTPSGSAAVSRSASGSAGDLPISQTVSDVTMEQAVTSADAGDDPIVYVNGNPMPYSQVTDEHHELMTPDEYTAYFEVYQAKNG